MFLRYPWQHGEYEQIKKEKKERNMRHSQHFISNMTQMYVFEHLGHSSFPVADTGWSRQTAPLCSPHLGKACFHLYTEWPTYLTDTLLKLHKCSTTRASTRDQQIHLHLRSGRPLLICFTTARKSTNRTLRRFCSSCVITNTKSASVLKPQCWFENLFVGVVKVFWQVWH